MLHVYPVRKKISLCGRVKKYIAMLGSTPLDNHPIRNIVISNGVYSHAKKNTNTINRLSVIIPLLLFGIIIHTSFSFASTVETINTDLLKREISDSNSKVLIVDFWATWCSPCRKQLPVLSNIYEKYKAKGLSIIGIAMDYNMKNVKKFVRKSEIKYPVYLGNEDIGYLYKVRAIPTTHIYDIDGNLVKKHTGFLNEDELTQIIENILEAKYAFNNQDLGIEGLQN